MVFPRSKNPSRRGEPPSPQRLVSANGCILLLSSSPEQESDERKCNYERYRGLVQNDFAGSECLVQAGRVRAVLRQGEPLQFGGTPSSSGARLGVAPAEGRGDGLVPALGVGGALGEPRPLLTNCS